MNLNVNEKEMAELLKLADPKENGLIEYKEWVPIASEIVYGWYLKSQVDQHITIKEVIKYFLNFLLIKKNLCFYFLDLIVLKFNFRKNFYLKLL